MNIVNFSWYCIGIGIVLILLFLLCVLYWDWYCSLKASIVHLWLWDLKIAVNTGYVIFMANRKNGGIPSIINVPINTLALLCNN
jgi:hypothetical protein